MPDMAFQIENYAGKIKALGVVWLIYAAISLLTGIAGLTFAKMFLFGPFGPWMHGPWGSGAPPMWFGPPLLHFVWVFLILRTCLAVTAGWGLIKRAPWGRVVAIVAAIFSLVKFPFGTAMGIWTLVTLLGYRNSTLYDQL
jgi:hypothetical protein